jgi:hypothetical protein
MVAAQPAEGAHTHTAHHLELPSQHPHADAKTELSSSADIESTQWQESEHSMSDARQKGPALNWGFAKQIERKCRG